MGRQRVSAHKHPTPGEDCRALICSKEQVARTDVAGDVDTTEASALGHQPWMTRSLADSCMGRLMSGPVTQKTRETP